MFIGMISKLYNMQGINTIKLITKGSKTVQQYDINWSNLILGKEALIHIKINTRTEVFNPKLILYNNPSIIELWIK
jgi:hypothetical protein